MSTYNHILAAVDGSPPSQHALEQIPHLPECRVTAAAVLPPPPQGLPAATPELEAHLRSPYDKALAAAQKWAAARSLPLETLLVKGGPHEALCAAARDYSCDLVVIGKRGQELPPGARMGKVTERVIGFCPTDVLVVPVRGTLDLSRLLLPVDGSRFSRRAADRALALAAASGSSLLVVSALDAPPGFATEVPEVAQDLLANLENLAAGVAQKARDLGLACHTRVAVGSAYRLILDQASEWNAGLIVMGSHGRTGLKRLLMGSVTERVVGEAPCPVLVVKADKG